ncbi:MAG: PAS sensor protein [Desulfobacca sp.]|nr:PAS sensor protein [Desulfobacca sp.]
MEDEMLVALDIRKILQELGHYILGTVDSGEEALQMVEEGRPDLVLMDIMLKGSLDGVKTAELIRNQFDIPVVYLTAYSDDPIIEQAKRTNPSGYLLKPFVTEELKISVEMALYKSKTDRQIKDSVARYRELADSITDVFFALNKELKTVYWNKTSEGLTGISARDAMGRSFYDFFPDTPELRDM